MLEFLDNLEENIENSWKDWNRVTEREFLESGLRTALNHFLGKECDYGFWNALAGSTKRGVIVVDGNNKMIFVTPPLVNTAGMTVGRGGFLDVNHKALSNRNNGIPTEHLINDHLSADNIKITLGDFTDSLYTWLRIMSLYGYKMELGSAEGELKEVTDESEAIEGVAEEVVDLMDGEDELC